MKLEEYLFRQKLSKAKFARQLGIARMYLHHILAGRNRPSPKLAKRISEATNGAVSINELLFPEDYPSPFIEETEG